MAFLQVRSVSRKDGIENISFALEKHQKAAVCGSTGAGKSTLLRIIAGLVQPDAGEVLLHHERVKGPSEKLVPGHPDIAYLSQHFELQKFLRVEQILSYANTMDAQAAGKLYELCDITHLMGRRTDELSGGERQRIALARLLTAEPRLLLLDEPFSNLDALHKATLKKILANVSDELDLPAVLVSHDYNDLLPWADFILVLKDGRIEQEGSPQQLYYNPVNEYVAGLFGPYNLYEHAAFLLNDTAETKRVIVRPEEIILDPEKNGKAATVQESCFFGSYYSLELLAHENGKKLTVYSKQEMCAGDTVYLSAHSKW